MFTIKKKIIKEKEGEKERRKENPLYGVIEEDGLWVYVTELHGYMTMLLHIM